MLKRIVNKLKIVADAIKNFFDFKNDLIYIVELADWSIKEDGLQVTKKIKELMPSQIRYTQIGARNKIIHFGSVNCLIGKNGIKKIRRNNKIVLTWFHVNPNDIGIKYIPELNQQACIVHAACQKTKQDLIKYGLQEDKIIVIPIGVDLNFFKKYSTEKKEKIKRKLDLPENKIIIGSFQKDGDGWESGDKPKLIKGPDVFCDTIEILSKKYPIHILLTGPARGYVKQRLEKAKISYTHNYLKNYLDIVNYYNTLDLYLIASRVEGGPKAILESWATGVPLVSTRVGMALDIIKNNANGILADSEDVNGLVCGAEKILENHEFKNKIIRNGLEDVKNYDWSKIIKKYFNIYQIINDS